MLSSPIKRWFHRHLRTGQHFIAMYEKIIIQHNNHNNNCYIDGMKRLFGFWFMCMLMAADTSDDSALTCCLTNWSVVMWSEVPRFSCRSFCALFSYDLQYRQTERERERDCDSDSHKKTNVIIMLKIIWHFSPQSFGSAQRVFFCLLPESQLTALICRFICREVVQ